MSEQETHSDSINMLETLLEEDGNLRQQHKIEMNEFPYIRNQLNNLLNNLKTQQAIADKQNQSTSEEKSVAPLGDDETLVYVYLFNIHGRQIKTWNALMLPNALRDHSVNRPVYGQESYIKNVMNAKGWQPQHAYAVFRVKKDKILAGVTETFRDDAQGNPLLKIHHGALEQASLQAFIHAGKLYRYDEDKGLIEETSSAAA